MCGIAGVVKKADITKTDIYKAYVMWLFMSDRGRTAHGCSVIDSGKRVINYYKCGYDKNEPKKSIDNPEALTMLNKCSDTLDNPNIILVHDRAASTLAGGNNNKENTQPLIVDYTGQKDFITLMHNGTIHNMEDIYYKETGKVPDDRYSDSYLAALLLAEEKYDWLKDYNGAASFVWYTTESNKIYFWRGESKKSRSSKSISEERPLFVCTKENELIFASTLDAIYKADLYPDVDSIDSLEENIVFCIDLDLEEFKLEKVISIDRSESTQLDKTYDSYHTRKYPSANSAIPYDSRAFGYNKNYRNPYNYNNFINEDDDDGEDDVYNYNLPRLNTSEGGFLEPIPFCINYFNNYHNIISAQSLHELTEFKGKISSTKVSLFKGLYYNNGGLMHSEFPMFNNLKDYDEANINLNNTIIASYLVSPTTSNTLSYKFKEDLNEEYFWKGLLCKNKEKFVELLHLTKANTNTILTPLAFSTYLKCPTAFSVLLGRGKVSFSVSIEGIYYKGKHIKEYDSDIKEIFPYTNLAYRSYNKSIACSYYNYCISKFVTSLLNNVFSIRQLEDLTSSINIAGIENSMIEKYSLEELKNMAKEFRQLEDVSTVKEGKNIINKIMI